jgi:manganese transport system permease protein
MINHSHPLWSLDWSVDWGPLCVAEATEVSARVWEFISAKYSFLAWSALGSALVGLCGGLLGVFLVLRRMSLVGDVLSHAMLPGLVGGFMLVERKGALGALYGGALATGVMAAVMLGRIAKAGRTREDAAMGLVLSGFFGAGVVLLSKVQANETGEQAGLTAYLFGQAASMTPWEVAILAALALITLAAVLLAYRGLLVLSFDEGFGRSVGMGMGWLHYALMGLVSMVIVASVQAVGVVLVVAMLITPAGVGVILARRLPWVLAVSAAIGVASGYLGALLSYLSEGWSSGPMMVLVASALFLVAAVIGRRGRVLG